MRRDELEHGHWYAIGGLPHQGRDQRLFFQYDEVLTGSLLLDLRQLGESVVVSIELHELLPYLRPCDVPKGREGFDPGESPDERHQRRREYRALVQRATEAGDGA